MCKHIELITRNIQGGQTKIMSFKQKLRVNEEAGNNDKSQFLAEKS